MTWSPTVYVMIITSQTQHLEPGHKQVLAIAGGTSWTSSSVPPPMSDSGESEALQLRVSLSPCSPIAVRLEIAFRDVPPDKSDAPPGLSSDGDQYVLHHLLGGEQALIAGEILRWETGGAVPSAAFERLHQIKFEIGVGHYEQMHAQQIDVLAARLSEMAVELGLPWSSGCRMGSRPFRGKVRQKVKLVA